MAVTQTGAVQRFAGAAANTGTASTTIAVPADAQLVVVGISGFGGVANWFSGGGMTFTKGGADTAMTAVSGGDPSGAVWQCGMFYLVSPDTGSNKTLKWDWIGAGAPGDASQLITVTFWTGLDTASPVRGSGGGQASGVPFTSSSITALTGDLIVAWASGSVSVDGSVNSWSNVSLLNQTVNAGGADGALATGSPSGNTTVAASTATGWADGGICAISIKPASSGATDTQPRRRRGTRWSPNRGPASFLKPSQPGIIISNPIWWGSQSDERPVKRVLSQDPPANSFFQAPQSPGWIEGATDRLPKRTPPRDDPGALGLFRPPQVAGYIQGATDRLPKPAPPRDDSGALGLFQPPQVAGYIQSVADRLLVRRYIDDAGALAQPPAAPASTIAGMGWFEPWDERPVASKSKPESVPAIALTPDTLPPQIAGIGWFEPPDPLSNFSKPKHEFPPSVVLTGATLPTPISGMGWFAPLDERCRFSKPKFELPQAAVLQPITIPGIGWFNPLDELSRFSKPKLELPPAFVSTFQTAIIAGMAWLTQTDVAPRKPIRAIDVFGFAPQDQAPPVGISGMAWFTPLDELPRFSKPRFELPPAHVVGLFVGSGTTSALQKDGDPDYWKLPWFHVEGETFAERLRSQALESLEKVFSETKAASSAAKAVQAYAKAAGPSLSDRETAELGKLALLLSDEETTRIGKLARRLSRAASQKHADLLQQRARETRALLIAHALQQDEEEAIVALML